MPVSQQIVKPPTIHPHSHIVNRGSERNLRNTPLQNPLGSPDRPHAATVAANRKNKTPHHRCKSKKKKQKSNHFTEKYRNFANHDRQTLTIHTHTTDIATRLYTSTKDKRTISGIHKQVQRPRNRTDDAVENTCKHHPRTSTARKQRRQQRFGTKRKQPLRNKMPWLDRKKDISRRRPATRMLQSIRQRTRQLRRPQPVSRTATKIQQALHTQNNRLQKMGTPAQGMRIRHKQHIRTATHQHHRDIPTLPL